MPFFERDTVKLYCETQGTGFPVSLIAPGGMRSAVSCWESTPWNAISHLSPDYRIIAMGQHTPA